MWALAVIGAVVALFTIVLLHEYGHFIVARWCGVRVLRFSIGFGKPIWRRVGRDGIEYQIGILPLGGYVKMLDEHSSDESDLPPDAFPKAALWKRFLIVVAGPMMNLVIAFVMFVMIGLLGVMQVKPVIGKVQASSIAAKAGFQSRDEFLSVADESTSTWQAVMMNFAVHSGDEHPINVTVRRHGHAQSLQLPMAQVVLASRDTDLFAVLGFKPFVPTSAPRVSQVLPGSVAKKAGVEPGDEILSFAGHLTPDWPTLVSVIKASRGKTGELLFKRSGVLHRETITLGSLTYKGKQQGFFGVRGQAPAYPAEYLRHQRLSLWQSIPAACIHTWRLVEMNARMLYKLVVGSISTEMLGGPISVFKAAGQATLAGVAVYLRFIAFISVTIGFVNILPIPGLDGGHIMYQLFELILRRPVRVATQQVGTVIGFALLIVIMIQATWNDVLSLWTR